MVNFCRDKYRLELHWKELVYLSDQECSLKGAFFSGPVLQNAQEIQAPDFIDLDLTPQHLIVLGSFYIVRLSWEGVEYQDGKVLLKGATLSNSLLKSLHKLENSDFIVVNTEKHEEEFHPFNLVYDSTVVKEDKTPYKYRK